MDSIESMICIVQIYIHYTKNVEVNIKVTNFVEIRQLKEAHRIAKEYLNFCNMRIIERNL
jgi:hypothetical protein